MTKQLVEVISTRVLIDEITDLQKRDNNNGYNVNLIRECINSGANINEYVTFTDTSANRQIKIPLFHLLLKEIDSIYAAEEHVKSVVTLFLEAGVDLLAIDSDGNNSFHRLTNTWPEELLELLEYVNEEQLHQGLAVRNNDLLLPWEVYIRERDHFIYAEGDLIKAINALMPSNFSYTSAERDKFNCDSYYGEEEGNYPENRRVLVYAIRNNLRQIIDYHQKAGIYLYGICDNENNTLLDLAKKNGDRELVTALGKLGPNQMGHKILRTVSMGDASFAFFADYEDRIESGNTQTYSTYSHI